MVNLQFCRNLRLSEWDFYFPNLRVVDLQIPFYSAILF